MSVHWRNREERRNLWFGFGASLAFHLALGLWLLLGTVVFALHKTALAELQARELAAKERARQEPPTVFVDVTPEQATAEPPKDAQFYSSANSLAANPDPTVDTKMPKIDGTQDKVPKTVDVLQPQPQLLQPAAPPEPLPEEKETARKESATEPGPGDLALVKPASERDLSEAARRQRPRTLAEARMQQGLLAGPKMRQEGGVKRRGAVSLDVKATPWGAYDAAVIAAIQKHWYDLLEDSSIAPRTGKVVVAFTMHYDGRITDLKVVEEDVGEILALYCRHAISDPAPFAPWPSDMRRMIGKDYRDIRVTFYYL